MILLEQIKLHIEAIYQALESNDLPQAVGYFYQFGCFIRNEFPNNDYMQTQDLFMQSINTHHFSRDEFAESILLGSAILYEAVSEFYIAHAMQDVAQCKKGVFSIRHLNDALKKGLLCFGSAMGDSYEIGLERIADQVREHYNKESAKIIKQIEEYINSAATGL
jgi:hypothetical protein